MKISEWAKLNGLHPRTAERWFRNGTLPQGVTAEKLPSGIIFVTDTRIQKPQAPSDEKVILYARVSTYDQKEDLDRQLQRLRNYAASKGYKIAKEYKEIASGMNDNRAKLNAILQDNTWTLMIIEHKDRLSRFGFNTLRRSLESSGRFVDVINDSDLDDDIVQDFIDVITSMCNRIYGRRSAANKKQKIIDEVLKDVQSTENQNLSDSRSDNSV